MHRASEKGKRTMKLTWDEKADRHLAETLARIDVLMTEKARLRLERPLWARLLLKEGK